MKRLFICYTYFQLLIAIQLKLNNFRNEYTDLWLSDHSINSDEVVKKLQELKIFDNVKLLKVKKDETFYKKLKSIVKNSLCITGYNDNFTFYDEIIFYNLEPILFNIEDFYINNKHTVIWSRMEEGLFSYENDFIIGKKMKIMIFLRKILLKGKKVRYSITDNIKNYYCFFPELKESHKEWHFITIPPVAEKLDELKRILNFIFGYTPENYKQKYIFFASSSDIDGRAFGETDLILKIANKVGTDNLLVKMHPRDTRKIYEKHGINVLKNSFVPWEVIQLNWTYHNNILLTVNSGAFISITTMLNQATKGYFLYSIIKNKADAFSKERDIKIGKTLSKLHSMGLAENIVSFTGNQL